MSKRDKHVNKKKIYGYLAAILLLGQGCLTDTITPDIIVDYTPKIVVNGLIQVGVPISVEVTSSIDIKDAEQPTLLRGANAVITPGNGSPVTLSFDELSEEYVSNLVPQDGDVINLRIIHPDFTQVISTVLIPERISATGNVALEAGVDTLGNPTDIVSISFNDDPQVDNFYKINLYYKNSTSGQWTPLTLSRNDPSLAEFNSFLLNDAGILFTDELFNGRTKTITNAVNSAFAFGSPNEKYRVDISSITEDYYKHFLSLQRAEDAKESSFNGGFNNAVVISSNINNGLGILGAANPSSIILP